MNSSIFDIIHYKLPFIFTFIHKKTLDDGRHFLNVHVIPKNGIKPSVYNGELHSVKQTFEVNITPRYNNLPLILATHIHK